MAYTLDQQTGDLVISGFDKGISPSPLKGIANMQGVNTATEQGEVMCSYKRVQQGLVNSVSTGTLSPNDTNHLTSSVVPIVGGIWITTGTSTITGLNSTTDYYVLSFSVGTIQLATTYLGSAITGLGATGSSTFTIKSLIGQPVAKATETYSDGTNLQYRYYILDANGLVWVNDSGVSTTGVSWFLPSTTTLANATGLGVLNGWLHVLYGNTIAAKPTVLLGQAWTAVNGFVMNSTATSPNPHFAFTGHQGRMYYTDGNWLGFIFPSSNLLSSTVNIQSYCSYTASTVTGTIATLIGGSLPSVTSGTRIPAVFFSGTTVPSALTQGTIYYIAYNTGASTFQVFAALSGGSALDIQTGSSGTQYFNTYYPISTSGMTAVTTNNQLLAFPFNEITTCMAELNNQLIIGCKGNTLYTWNQVVDDLTTSFPIPNDLIPLPESNVVAMLTVSNTVYVFAGNKGNIYITNGSSAAGILTVPDYCAGIAGTASSYFEPYFVWGDVMYLRGRVYFSVLDQTANKAGNCGGIWSFVPTQNYFFGQDYGVSLRLENQNSYVTYSGVATVLIPSQNQAAISPQFWSGWYSDLNSKTYGIDNTGTTTGTTAIVETDLIPTGTLWNKKTFRQVEYKLSSPLASSSESVAIKYRKNSTGAWTALPTVQTESTTDTGGVFQANFEKTQWLQLQATLTPLSSSSSSFVRLTEIRLR